MLRKIAVAAAAACICSQAGAEPVRVPVTVYLISPADRPDPQTILTATRQVTHEVKHVAATWGGQLFLYVNAGSDCQASQATVTVVKPPDHGRFIVNRVSVPPYPRLKAALPKGDPRAACRTLAVQAGGYQPDYDYLGRDHMTVSFQEATRASPTTSRWTSAAPSVRAR